MSDRPRYEAHARRIEVLRRAYGSSGHAGPLADYYTGYRAGMVRALGDPADPEQARTHARVANEALHGRCEDRARAAWGCGYVDGRCWDDLPAHRGLLRLAITVCDAGNVSAFSRRWGVAGQSVRQMLAGTRPVPTDRHEQLVDFVAGAPY